MQSDCSFNIIQKYWSEIPVKLQSFECSQHTLVLVSNDESSSFCDYQTVSLLPVVLFVEQMILLMHEAALLADI